jgi:hypothetical protein
MSARYIHFVYTGLQVLNCAEYIHAKKIENAHHVLFVVREKHVADEINSLLHLIPYKTIFFLPKDQFLAIKNPHFRYIQSLFNAYFQVSKFKFQPDDVLIGNDLNPYFRFACRNAKSNKIVFIDDGTGSVHYNGENPFLKLRGVKHKFAYRFLGIDKIDLVPNVYFTAHQLVHYQLKSGQIIEENKFQLLKHLGEGKPQKKVAYFIGDPIVERNYISEEKYISSVKQAIEHFSDFHFLYIPRMSEPESIVQKIAAFVEIKRNKVPFEVFMASNDYLPMLMIGFHSTVLFNANKIFGNKIQYFFIKIPDFTADTHLDKMEKMWMALSRFATEFQPNFGNK